MSKKMKLLERTDPLAAAGIELRTSQLWANWQTAEINRLHVFLARGTYQREYQSSNSTLMYVFTC